MTIAPHGFQVLRPDFPGVSLDVHLKLSGEAIEFQYRTGAGGKHAASEWSGTLTFRVNTDGALYLNQYGRDFVKFAGLQGSLPLRNKRPSKVRGRFHRCTWHGD